MTEPRTTCLLLSEEGCESEAVVQPADPASSLSVVGDSALAEPARTATENDACVRGEAQRHNDSNVAVLAGDEPYPTSPRACHIAPAVLSTPSPASPTRFDALTSPASASASASDCAYVPWVRFAACSVAGRRSDGCSKNNQDHYGVVRRLGNLRNVHLFMVCDSHGPQGAEVSFAVTDLIPRVMTPMLLALPRTSLMYNANLGPFEDAAREGREMRAIARVMRDSIREVQKRLFDGWVSEDGSIRITVDATLSGTTVCASLFVGQHIFTMNVGDSRAVLGRVPARSKDSTGSDDPCSAACPGPGDACANGEGRATPPRGCAAPSSAGVTVDAVKDVPVCGANDPWVPSQSVVASVAVPLVDADESVGTTPRETRTSLFTASRASVGADQECPPVTRCDSADAAVPLPTYDDVQGADKPANTDCGAHHDPPPAVRVHTTLNTVRMTEDHKPGHADERARIEAAHGIIARSISSVTGFPVGPLRVWLPVHDPRLPLGEDPADNTPQNHPETTEQGVRVLARGPGLAMSRSVGDYYADLVGVICDPVVTYHYMRRGRDAVVVLGTDGVWEFLSPRNVVSCAMSRSDPSAAARAVCRRVERAWTRHMARFNSKTVDDITVIIVRLWPDADEEQNPHV